MPFCCGEASLNLPGASLTLGTVSFLDSTLVSELNISTPMDDSILDGRFIDRVTHIPTPINLRVSGNHSETIQFLFIKSPQIPVVFGFYWLQRYNPLYQLVYRCHHGLESGVHHGIHHGLEPRPLSEGSATCPGTSSWGLGRCPGPLYHPRGPDHFASAALTL